MPGRRAGRAASFFSARELAVCALTAGLLTAGQYVLSFVAGVEIVTALLLVFCCTFGRKAGVLTATAFSLLRCILFGFFPSVVALYLVYYNAFALFFGSFAGRKKNVLLLCVFAVLFTAGFTLLDDLLYPLFSGIRGNAWRLYFFSSLPVMGAQCLSAAVTVPLLYYPFARVFSAAGTVFLFSVHERAGK